MAALPAVLMAAGTAVSVVGSLEQAAGAREMGEANARAAEYQAQLSQRDATQQQLNALNIAQQTRLDAAEARQEAVRFRARMRASYGASGVEMAGTPLDVLADTATEQELQARRIENEGRTRMYETGLKSQGFEEEGVLSKARAGNERRAGAISSRAYFTSGIGTALTRLG